MLLLLCVAFGFLCFVVDCFTYFVGVYVCMGFAFWYFVACGCLVTYWFILFWLVDCLNFVVGFNWFILLRSGYLRGGFVVLGIRRVCFGFKYACAYCVGFTSVYFSCSLFC